MPQQTARILLSAQPSNRSSNSSFDARYVNCYTEVIDTPSTQSRRLYCIKRAGYTDTINTAYTGTGRGCYYWSKTDKTYSIIDGRIFADSTRIDAITLTSVTSVGTTATATKVAHGFVANQTVIISGANESAYNGTFTIQTVPTADTFTYTMLSDPVDTATGTILASPFTTTTGWISWSEGFSSSNEILVFVDGTKGFWIDTSNVLHQITDTDFPTPHKISVVYLDGFFFVINSSTGDIYNCEDLTPNDWAALNVVNAEIYPDKSISLAKMRNLLCAIGERSTEFFIDAGNASGSPVNRIQETVIKYGTPTERSVQYDENKIIFVSQSKTGSRGVGLIEDYNYVDIATPAVRRILEEETNTITSCESALFKERGHLMYALNLTSQSRTIVYDFETKQWHERTSKSGSNQVMFAGIQWTDSFTGYPQFLHRSNGKLYRLDPEITVDGSDNIKVVIRTNPFDNENGKRKFCSRLELIGDRQEFSSNISIRYSNDDGQSWSTARTVDSSTRMFLKQLGNFRRRTFEITYEGAYNFRVEALELDIEEGNS